MHPPLWIVHSHLLTINDEDSGHAFSRALAKHRNFLVVGDHVSERQIDAFNESEQPIIAYGSIQFIRQFQRWTKGIVPGSYAPFERLRYSNVAPRMVDVGLLNDNYLMLPWCEVKRGWSWLLTAAPTGGEPMPGLFVRPDASHKPFAGQVFATYPHTQGREIDDTTLCVFAPAKRLEAEYRVVIANRQVVTASQYMQDGEPCVQPFEIESDPETLGLAQRIAEMPWQPDICYTADIGLWEGHPKLIEINSFSCAGLYACDYAKIIEAVSHAAMLEYTGALTLED
ncbi:ATP-grasp domain-containing protein [Sinimarinibacterium sp. NLF-5-8]|uniref:ATP-grasp domain-containing protein n=1 Tax=Sinimarinibacterium sp. NLF-5-8 TaxID=2698684 RepID=UPI00137C0302|nr:ATP-grasp domain-containing protein [Sinimarinibacterium sp. NLF-5-8]QHS09148.1 ATP-grasp domain-containing protein [Sinimarinibacterium sp. NLF-5-8]